MLLIILFIVICAFFTASEISFTSANRIRIRYWASIGRTNAKFTKNFLDSPFKFLSTVLVGTNIAIIATSVIASEFFLSRYHTIGDTLSVIIVTFTILIFGEIIPKSIAGRFPTRLSLILSRTHNLLYYLLYPIIQAVNISSRGLLLLLGVKALSNKVGFRREEIGLACGKALKFREAIMISKLLGFGEKSVKEAMIPRHRILAASIDTSFKEILNIIEKSGFSRIPIFKENIDDVVGIVVAKDLLGKEKMKIKKIIRPCSFVPEIQRISTLFEDMRKKGTNLAIVKNEYGETVGLITMEDILEELFGEIRDEYDVLEESVEKIKDRVYLVRGDTRIEEIENEIPVRLPRGSYETIGGLILNVMGKIPHIGTKLTVNGTQLTVISMVKRRIEKVRLEISS
jgi:putative hemolysin